jgi:hypothetical protein
VVAATFRAGPEVRRFCEAVESLGRNREWFFSRWDELCRENEGRFVSVCEIEPGRSRVVAFDSEQQMKVYLEELFVLDPFAYKAVYVHSTKDTPFRMPAPGTPRPAYMTFVSGPVIEIGNV